MSARVVARADVFSTAPFAEAHASTIVAAAGGLVCAWFGGTREGAPDVAVWLATAGPGGSFGPPRRVAVAADGRGAPVACWNPVLHRLSDGRLLLFWREGPSPRRWSSQLAVSRDDGSTWGAAEALPAGFLGPIRSKPLTLADGTLLCPSSTETLGWRAHIERHDPRTGGWTFVQHLNRPWAMLAIQPTLLDHGRGRLQALCRTRHGVIAESWSEDGGGRWSPLRLTALANPNSAIDAVTLADGRHALVYNPSARARTPLVLALADDGRSWRDVATLDDGQGELSYPAVVQAPDGLLHVTWTWRRRRIRHAVVAL